MDSLMWDSMDVRGIIPNDEVSMRDFRFPTEALMLRTFELSDMQSVVMLLPRHHGFGIEGDRH